MEDNKTKKTSRTEDSREKTKRTQPWRPPSSLEAPQAPEGFKHRWIRAETLGVDDKKNMASRLREGFELVRADEYPDFASPTIDNGSHAGVIGVGGLLLARIPIETVESRSQYFREMTENQEQSVDNNLYKEQHRSMPITVDRQSRVTFGGGRGDKK
tara:strand:+ start:882 stop:1352 length:471 start_codon:yes stop_codon:yes gene_type:complete